MQNDSESALRRLAVILKVANDAITIQDLQGNVKAWNIGAEKLYGYTEEALKMDIQQLLPPEQREMEKEVKILRGLLPIYASCKEIKDDQGYWHQIETYYT